VPNDDDDNDDDNDDDGMQCTIYQSHTLPVLSDF